MGVHLGDSKRQRERRERKDKWRDRETVSYLSEVTASSTESWVTPWMVAFRKNQARNFNDTNLDIVI